MPRIYTSIILLFDTQDPAQAVDNLKAGLRRLNQRLPYIKGHVSATDASVENRGRLGIKWSAADRDIELTEPTFDGLDEDGRVPLLDISFPELKGQGAPLKYFPRRIMPLPVVTDLHSSLDAPVLAVNYTLLDGGLTVGLCVQHNVMDGTGMVELIRFWADCTRFADDSLTGCTAPDPEEPLHRDRLLRLATTRQDHNTAEVDSAPGDSEKANHISPQSSSETAAFRDLLARHREFRLLSDAPAAALRPSAAPAAVSKIFTFDTAKLEAVKQLVRGFFQEAACVTTNNVLSAIMWSCVTRVRAARRRHSASGGLGAPSSKLGFAINGRTRLSTTRSSTRGEPFKAVPFLGNVNLFGMAEMPVPELLAACQVPGGGGLDGGDGHRQLARVVEEIARAVKRVTPGHVAEVMDLIDMAPDVSDIAPGWESLHGADLSITSWANMGLYEADFGEGVGRPELMRVPWMTMDGLLIVLPRKRGLGKELWDAEMRAEEAGAETIEVVVVLHPQDVVALGEDSTLCSYLL
ncbi:hypothetical protein N656DRAFT_705214 [Canariomyces notabilis]|uniref:Trichothecene 3-O-acetyltransferase-like N-terminal domain-containing protein n=1 Tax=Canariomyces notabilis TaxID=2074819 RepID=A0AAN6TI77_9PEZI|nr:hypothetical protein N656DRAFT_705214 [Canariomyces arenarius]